MAWRPWWKSKQKHTWMKNSLGFPTSDLQRSPRKSDVSSLSSMKPSVPNNTPSSPWLSRTQTKEAHWLWSSLEAEKNKKRVTRLRKLRSVTSGTGRVLPPTHPWLEAFWSDPPSGRCAPSLCSPGLRTLSSHWLRRHLYRSACSCLWEISKEMRSVWIEELQTCCCYWEETQRTCRRDTQLTAELCRSHHKTNLWSWTSFWVTDISLHWRSLSFQIQWCRWKVGRGHLACQM